MSTHFTFDFDRVNNIVADAVGKPGQRTFFLQARQDRRTATLVMEKQQVAALAASILQLLEELEEKHPDLTMSSLMAPERLEEPMDPAFRVGQMGLGYDENQDMMVLVAQALVVDDEETISEDDVPRARFYATREQMRALSEHALEAVASGRPDCPLCGRPIDPEGHFCPRTNGHAYPLSV
ncbi:MAG: DUF3090 family protein [Caldilineaceae bacterium]|nr:DUF3090 family protein [Caldilineaceae bacterium]